MAPLNATLQATDFFALLKLQKASLLGYPVAFSFQPITQNQTITSLRSLKNSGRLRFISYERMSLHYWLLFKHHLQGGSLRNSWNQWGYMYNPRVNPFIKRPFIRQYNSMKTTWVLDPPCRIEDPQKEPLFARFLTPDWVSEIFLERFVYTPTML